MKFRHHEENSTYVVLGAVLCRQRIALNGEDGSEGGLSENGGKGGRAPETMTLSSDMEGGETSCCHLGTTRDGEERTRTKTILQWETRERAYARIC